MLLEPTSEQEFFRDTSQRFLRSELPMDSVRAIARAGDAVDREWWKRGAQLGWTSLLGSEAVGGGTMSDLGLVDLTLIADLFGRSVAPGPLAGCNVAVAALSTSDEAAHRQAASEIVAGEATAAWCFAEPSRRPRFDTIELSAQKIGDGWILTGTKSPVEAACDVDFLVVVAQTAEGLTQFLVPSGAQGLTCSPLQSLDLVRRFGIVRFDGVRISQSAVIGESGCARAEIARLLQIAQVIQVAESVGAADHVFAFTLEWMFDRYSFGRPLASYQELKHRFADMRVWLEASHATAEAAARAVASGDARAGMLTSVAKSYVDEYMAELVQDCVQMHGGIAMTWDHDIHLYLRRISQNRVLHGLPSEHRARVAAAICDDGVAA